MISEKRRNRFKQVASQRFQDVVVLENIHDPHNAMAAMRNCDGFGVQTVHFVFETEKQFNPKELGKITSSSANKWIDVFIWNTVEECLANLKEQGYQLLATVINPETHTLAEVDFNRQKSAIVFGNEGFGISDTAKQMADESFYISMSGFVDSLNLSVSVGIVLYELYRQREERQKFVLSKQEQKALMKKWINNEIHKKYRL
ncbi:MAG: RNA methyltransferase [Patescibacteria group bacterium]